MAELETFLTIGALVGTTIGTTVAAYSAKKALRHAAWNLESNQDSSRNSLSSAIERVSTAVSSLTEEVKINRNELHQTIGGLRRDISDIDKKLIGFRVELLDQNTELSKRVTALEDVVKDKARLENRLALLEADVLQIVRSSRPPRLDTI